MVTRTLISRNTWRLIQDNLIQSQVNQTDRRIVRLTLTTNGQERVQRSVRQVQANLKNFNQSHDLEKLTKQVETLSQQLAKVLSPVKLTLIKTKTQFFLSDQIVVIFRHGLVISFSGNELIREVHYSSTNLFL